MILEKNIQHRLMLSFIGLLIGLFTYFLIEQIGEIKDQESVPMTELLTLSFVSMYGFFIAFTWDGEHKKRLLISTVFISCIHVLSLWWILSFAGEIEEDGDAMRFVTWLPFTFLSCFVLVPYLGIFKGTGTVRFEYTKLFEYSWNNFLITIVGCVVTGLIWMILGVWAGLFHLISIEVFFDFFFNSDFVTIVTPMMFTFGIALGRENKNVIASLLRMTLTIFRALFPVVIFVLLFFLISLPFTGLEGLFGTKMASLLLFSAFLLGIIFFNSVFQDGKGELPYDQWLMVPLHIFLISLPIICGIALYSFWLRVDQYGYTQERFLGLIALSLAMMYGLGYAVSAGKELLGKNENWLEDVTKVNTLMALILVSILTLIHSPILDPLRIAASNQYQRLIDGKISPNQFDVGYLYYELGTEGHKILTTIEENEEAKFSELRERIRVLREEGRLQEVEEEEIALELSHLEIFPSNTQIPDSLFKQIQKEVKEDTWLREVCVKNKECIVFGVNIDDDSQLEYFFTGDEIPTRLKLYDFKDQKWKSDRNRQYVLVSEAKKISLKNVKKILSKEKPKDVVPQYRDVQIGDYRFSKEIR
jgi:hypothetical protein